MISENGGLAKVVGLIGAGAKLSVKPLLVLLIGSFVTMVMAIVYLRWAMDLHWGWALLPLYLMALPLTGQVFYWFALDGLSRLPDSLLESKETYAILKQRYAERRKGKEIKGIGPIATTRRMFLLGGLIWDSRDVIDAASNLYSIVDLFNPLFWMLMFVSLLSSVILSAILTLVCGSHYFFT